MTKQPFRKLTLAGGTLVVSAGLLFGACGSDDDSNGETETPPTATEAPAVTPTMTTETPPAATPTEEEHSHGDATETGAASLRALLTAQLQEHVFLAAAATGAALDGRDAEFEQAAGALDENSVALSESIASVYGDDAGAAFLELWRTHIGFFVDYTVGTATSDMAMVEAARAGLDEYRTDFGAFIASANPNLPADAVAEQLTPHVASLFAVIDAQAADDPQTFLLLREAADHMPHTAAVLAGGIAAQFPDMFDGDVDSPASQLRSLLTAQLQEHVFLAAAATGAALDGRNDEFEQAAAALDENSVALAASIESVYGEDAGTAFLELWRTHIGFFVDYTVGTASDDMAMVEAARAGLDDYRTDFGAFLASANPNLPADAVAEELVPHVATLFAVIDAQAADSDDTYGQLREAASHMPHTAAVLAGGIAAQFPETFTS